MGEGDVNLFRSSLGVIPIFSVRISGVQFSNVRIPNRSQQQRYDPGETARPQPNRCELAECPGPSRAIPDRLAVLCHASGNEVKIGEVLQG